MYTEVTHMEGRKNSKLSPDLQACAVAQALGTQLHTTSTIVLRQVLRLPQPFLKWILSIASDALASPPCDVCVCLCVSVFMYRGGHISTMDCISPHMHFA